MPEKPATLPFSLAFIALLLGAVGMGVSPVFVRLSEVGPFASAFWRVGLALPPLFLWFWLETRANNTTLRKAFTYDRAVLLSGIFFAGDLIFWHLSIQHTTIANATLMACLAPVWVLLLSGLFIGERVDKSAFLGLGLCLLGAALLIGSSFAIAPNRLIGDLYGMVTSLFFGLYFLAIRVARRTHLTGALSFKSTTITAAILFAVALIWEPTLWPQTLSGVAALLALGIISQTGGQGLLTLALGSLSASFSSLIIFIEALAAAIFGWLIFNETLTPMQFAGGGLILAGIWVARPKPS